MKTQTAIISSLTTILVIASAEFGCGYHKKNGQNLNPNVEIKPIHEEKIPVAEDETGPENPKNAVTAGVSEFLETSVATDQKFRKDDGQILLGNSKGDMVVSGVTRSKIGVAPSLFGDMFFTRYVPGKGWSDQPVQVPVLDFTVPILPAPDSGPIPLPVPAIDAGIVVKGGRLLDTGMAIVVGELSEKKSFGPIYQQNIEETKNAITTTFLSVFGVTDSGMNKAFSYGLTGKNTIVGTAAARSVSSVLVAGSTASGLRKNAGEMITETPQPANYIAEFGSNGNILRYFSSPMTRGDGVVENIKALTSNSSLAVAIFSRKGDIEIYAKSFRESTRGTTFLDSVETLVCETATAGASFVTVTSANATETELVVAVEIIRPESPDIAFPCFEIFKILPQGALVKKHEVANMISAPTIPGTTHVKFVKDDRILLIRSRANTGAQGQGAAVVTFLFDRPIVADGFASKLWTLARPQPWYDSESVAGLNRQVRSVFWPKGTKQDDVVWALSTDITARLDDHQLVQKENLVHLGTYTALPQISK
jgi:hypothetical protein